MEFVRNVVCGVGKSAQKVENEVQGETWGKNHIENELTQGQLELLQKFGRRPFMNK